MSNVTTSKGQVANEADRAKEAAAGAGDKMREAAGHAGQAASGMASAIGQKASEVASTVGQKASNVASTVGHKAEDATASVGRGMENLGEKIREKGPESGMLGRAKEAVAGTLEKGGRYLEEKKLSGMAEDFTDLIRRNPIPAVLIGIGLGFLLARTLRS
jgi:hypothetical protein